MSGTFKVPMGNLGKRIVADGKARLFATRKGMKASAERGAAYLARKTTRRYLGQMANSWGAAGTPDGARIRNTAPHAGIIEGGARPHKVSPEGRQAILQWVLTVIAPQVHGPATAFANKAALRNARRIAWGGAAGGTAKALGKAADAISEAMGIVWAICRRLAEKGSKGDFVAKKALPELGRFARLEIDREMKQAAAAAAVGAAFGSLGGGR